MTYRNVPEGFCASVWKQPKISDFFDLVWMSALLCSIKIDIDPAAAAAGLGFKWTFVERAVSAPRRRRSMPQWV
jgi:hypothetical protein